MVVVVVVIIVLISGISRLPYHCPVFISLISDPGLICAFCCWVLGPKPMGSAIPLQPPGASLGFTWSGTLINVSGTSPP